MEFETHREVDDLERFAIQSIRLSGEEALSYYGKSKTDVKFDEELVTAAELHLRNFFENRLEAAFPEHQVFNNNGADTNYTHEERRYLWIFDPIDGVDNFQTGIPIWGISLALFENLWPIFGLFYMPTTGDLFHARAERSAFRGKSKINLSMQENVDDESVLLTYSRFHQHYNSKFPGKVRNLGCTAAHICYVAMGRADAALISNESFQDLATVRIIIESAGGKIFRMDGSEFFLADYLNGQKIADKLLVTAPDKFSTVLDCLKII